MATCLASFLEKRTSRLDQETKGAGAAQVRRKKGCFAHVVHAWYVEHVEKLSIVDTKKVC